MIQFQASVHLAASLNAFLTDSKILAQINMAEFYIHKFKKKTEISIRYIQS